MGGVRAVSHFAETTLGRPGCPNLGANLLRVTGQAVLTWKQICYQVVKSLFHNGKIDPLPGYGKGQEA